MDGFDEGSLPGIPRLARYRRHPVPMCGDLNRGMSRSVVQFVRAVEQCTPCSLALPCRLPASQVEAGDLKRYYSGAGVEEEIRRIRILKRAIRKLRPEIAKFFNSAPLDCFLDGLSVHRSNTNAG
jgi:hypothetical protein